MRAIPFCLVAMLFVSGCGPTSSQADEMDGSGIIDASHHQPDSSIGNRDVYTSSEGQPICDEQDFFIEHKPVRLMLLQDLSGSMIGQKWTDAKAALAALLTAWTGPEIEFGYDIFPDGSQEDWNGWWCGTVNPVQIDCAQNTQQAIMTHQDNVDPDLGFGLTPLWCAMNNFNNPSYAPSLYDSTREPYVVVISDGTDTCGVTCPHSGGSVTENEIRQVTQELLGNGIKSIVIGFGSDVDPAQLNAIAQEGGTQFSTYFIASDQASLGAAFDQIATSVVTCIYDIHEPAATADPNNVNFYFDDQVVQYDADCAAGAGWRWVDDTHTQVEFCQQACDELKSQTVDEISARFGCPTVVR